MSKLGQFFIDLRWIRGPSRGDPRVKFQGFSGGPGHEILVKFCVFGKMSGDPPGGLLGSVGEFFRCRFSEILKNFWWSQNRSRTLPGAFLAHPRKIFFRTKIRVQMMTVGRPRLPQGSKYLRDLRSQLMPSNTGCEFCF